MNNNKIKNIILAVLVIGLVGMTIAYASLTQTLTINNNQATVSSNWRVRFAPTVTTSDTTRSSGKNVYGTMDKNGDTGLCMYKGGIEYCYKTNNYEYESVHIFEAFSDGECAVEEENYAINCSADGYEIRVTSNGALRFGYDITEGTGYGCLAFSDTNEIWC